MLLVEIIRIAADGGDEIVLRDDVGHAPGRIEIDLDDLGRDLRRRARRLADDDIGVEGEVAVVHRLGDEVRHVDQHVARRLIDAHQPLDALEIGLELRQALLGRHVERGQGPLVDESADAETPPDLEAGEAVEKFLVEGRAARTRRQSRLR